MIRHKASQSQPRQVAQDAPDLVVNFASDSEEETGELQQRAPSPLYATAEQLQAAIRQKEAELAQKRKLQSSDTANGRSSAASKRKLGVAGTSGAGRKRPKAPTLSQRAQAEAFLEEIAAEGRSSGVLTASTGAGPGPEDDYAGNAAQQVPSAQLMLLETVTRNVYQTLCCDFPSLAPGTSHQDAGTHSQGVSAKAQRAAELRERFGGRWKSLKKVLPRLAGSEGSPQASGQHSTAAEPATSVGLSRQHTPQPVAEQHAVQHAGNEQGKQPVSVGTAAGALQRKLQDHVNASGAGMSNPADAAVQHATALAIEVAAQVAGEARRRQQAAVPNQIALTTRRVSRKPAAEGNTMAAVLGNTPTSLAKANGPNNSDSVHDLADHAAVSPSIAAAVAPNGTLTAPDEAFQAAAGAGPPSWRPIATAAVQELAGAVGNGTQLGSTAELSRQTAAPGGYPSAHGAPSQAGLIQGGKRGQGAASKGTQASRRQLPRSPVKTTAGRAGSSGKRLSNMGSSRPAVNNSKSLRRDPPVLDLGLIGQKYESPLLRLTVPWAQEMERHQVSDQVLRHALALHPSWPLCSFEMRGVCKDRACSYQMEVDTQQRAQEIKRRMTGGKPSDGDGVAHRNEAPLPVGRRSALELRKAMYGSAVAAYQRAGESQATVLQFSNEVLLPGCRREQQDTAVGGTSKARYFQAAATEPGSRQEQGTAGADGALAKRGVVGGYDWTAVFENAVDAKHHRVLSISSAPQQASASHELSKAWADYLSHYLYRNPAPALLPSTLPADGGSAKRSAVEGPLDALLKRSITACPGSGLVTLLHLTALAARNREQVLPFVHECTQKLWLLRVSKSGQVALSPHVLHENTVLHGYRLWLAASYVEDAPGGQRSSNAATGEGLTTPGELQLLKGIVWLAAAASSSAATNCALDLWLRLLQCWVDRAQTSLQLECVHLLLTAEAIGSSSKLQLPVTGSGVAYLPAAMRLLAHAAAVHGILQFVWFVCLHCIMCEQLPAAVRWRFGYEQDFTLCLCCNVDSPYPTLLSTACVGHNAVHKAVSGTTARSALVKSLFAKLQASVVDGAASPAVIQLLDADGAVLDYTSLVAGKEVVVCPVWLTPLLYSNLRGKLLAARDDLVQRLFASQAACAVTAHLQQALSDAAGPADGGSVLPSAPSPAIALAVLMTTALRENASSEPSLLHSMQLLQLHLVMTSLVAHSSSIQPLGAYCVPSWSPLPPMAFPWLPQTSQDALPLVYTLHLLEQAVSREHLVVALEEAAQLCPMAASIAEALLQTAQAIDQDVGSLAWIGPLVAGVAAVARPGQPGVLCKVAKLLQDKFPHAAAELQVLGEQCWGS